MGLCVLAAAWQVAIPLCWTSGHVHFCGTLVAVQHFSRNVRFQIEDQRRRIARVVKKNIWKWGICRMDVIREAWRSMQVTLRYLCCEVYEVRGAGHNNLDGIRNKYRLVRSVLKSGHVVDREKNLSFIKLA
jgi:hypothetical protein